MHVNSHTLMLLCPVFELLMATVKNSWGRCLLCAVLFTSVSPQSPFTVVGPGKFNNEDTFVQEGLNNCETRKKTGSEAAVTQVMKAAPALVTAVTLRIQKNSELEYEDICNETSVLHLN